MHRKAARLLATAAAIFILAFAPAAAAATPGSVKGPVAASHPVAVNGQWQISERDRCPVCGMYPAKRPKNAAGMVLDDGRTFYFCGNGCLLRTWRNSPIYLGVGREHIQHMMVRNYFTGEVIDARSAFWVAGSDVVGPMGPALVTLKSAREAAQFKLRHGAKIIFRLDQMDDALWNSLFAPK